MGTPRGGIRSAIFQATPLNPRPRESSSQKRKCLALKISGRLPEHDAPKPEHRLRVALAVGMERVELVHQPLR